MAEIATRRQRTPETALAPRGLEPLRLMRDLLRWDPFRALGPELALAPSTEFFPELDMKETKDAFVFKADLPGIKESDIEVNVSENRLTISGRREEEQEEKGEAYYACERRYGSFTRSFALPVGADIEHVKAELKDGVLSVIVPKTAGTVGKKVPIGKPAEASAKA